MNDDVLSPGMVVAETYDVEKIIGRGAMGQVYSAHHRRLPGLRVAIKVMTGQALGSDRLLRFRREAEIAAKLSHPNIVQIIDYNTLPSGQPYLVMEFLRGENLHQRLKAGPLKLDVLKRIVREVGAALDAAHQAGVVHRDLKPENIYLVPTPTGDQAKVLDFGISKLNDGSGVKTSDSMIIGTPRYMSPEQAMGLNSQLTARSDIFSFATICYEALTGQPMFDSENVAQLLYQVAQVPHHPLLALVPELPQNVARAIENALEKDPARRTPDVLTFVHEFAGGAVIKRAPTEAPAAALEPVSRTQQPTRDERVAPVQRDEQAPPAQSPTTRSLAPVIVTVLAAVLVFGGAIAFAVTLNQVAPKPTPGPSGALMPVAVQPTPTPEPAPVEPDAAEPLPAPAQPPSQGVPRVEPRASRVIKAKPIDTTPLTEEEETLLTRMRADRRAENWGALMKAMMQVLQWPRTSRARQEGLLLIFEAACARRETSVTSLFNRLVTDYPDTANQAVDACHRHLPDQAFDRP